MPARKKRKMQHCAYAAALTAAALLLPGRAASASHAANLPPAVMHPARDRIAHDAHANGMHARRNETSTTSGRYGHSAVYLPYKRQVLFLGGQVGTRGSFFTNQVLSLDMTLPYDARNPSAPPELASGLPPTAWAASTVDAQQRVWVIGGITEDCDDEASAYLLEDGSQWKAVGKDRKGAKAPRRRQAQAVALADGSMEASIYVFGGIAESHTCSLETVGYLAMDSWNATDPDHAGSAQTTLWTSQPELQTVLPNGPPVSDYAAVRLQQTDSILYLGGQDASGRLMGFDRILQYNTTSKLWSMPKIDGIAPQPRLGLTAAALLDGRVVVHGGAGSDGTSTADVYVLDTSTPAKWAWHQPTLGAAGPGRAWHTSTLTDNGVLVFAYGLDSVTGETKDDIHFLQTTDSLKDWSWSTSNPLAVAGSVKGHVLPNASGAAQPKVLAQTDAEFLNNTLPVPYNPKAALVGSLPGGNDPNGDEASSASEQPVPSSTSPAVAHSTAVLSAAAPETTDSGSAASPFTGSSADASTAADTAPTTSTEVIAGSVTAAFLLALAAGAVGLYMRRKASKSAEAAPSMAEADDSAPPVSHLLYTRQAPRRTLSLGSSIRSNREKSAASRRLGHRHQPSESFEPISEQEARETVDEFGRLGLVSPQEPGFSLRQETEADAHRRIALLSGSRPDLQHAASSDSMHSQASVASYPFLGSMQIPHVEQRSSDDRPLRRQQSANTRALLRSHSLSTTSSKSSSRWEDDVGRTPLAVVNAPASTPLPAREFDETSSIPYADPFADTAEVKDGDLASAQAIYMRMPESIPASLRPHTPSRF